MDELMICVPFFLRLLLLPFCTSYRLDAVYGYRRCFVCMFVYSSRWLSA